MRSKTLKLIVKIVLSLIAYGLLFSVFSVLDEYFGIDDEITLRLIKIAVFAIVYKLVSVVVEKYSNSANAQLRAFRKENGGRDIAAEEAHEDEVSGMISLSLNDRK